MIARATPTRYWKDDLKLHVNGGPLFARGRPLLFAECGLILGCEQILEPNSFLKLCKGRKPDTPFFRNQTVSRSKIASHRY